MSDALPARRRITVGGGGRSIEGPKAGRLEKVERDGPHGRTPARQKATALVRERHQADYAILVIVVALTAIGILVVYSSSAIKAYIATDDTLTVVGPQIAWAGLGLIAMIAMMRVDYRYLRLASVPFLLVSMALLVLVFVPDYNIVVGGSARWLRLPGLESGHATVVWSKGQYIGCAFERPLHPAVVQMIARKSKSR